MPLRIWKNGASFFKTNSTQNTRLALLANKKHLATRNFGLSKSAFSATFCKVTVTQKDGKRGFPEQFF
jgi:hypothetical protein